MNDRIHLQQSDAPTVSPDVTIGFDLARHRSLCVAEIAGERTDVPLAPNHRGLILRWVDAEDRKHRVTDRMLDKAGVDQAEAVRIARSVAECVFPEALPSTPFVAVPSAFGPACRSAMIDGFRAEGIELDDTHLIDRPVAALASWLHHRRSVGSPDPIGPMLVLDNDGGQISVCAVDTDAKRIAFTTPLSSGPEEAVDTIIDRLHTVVRELDRLRSGHDLVRSDEWSTVSASVSQIAVSGSMCEHPLFLDLIARVLPAAAVVHDPVVGDPGDIVASGLISLDVLSTWRAGWPTLDIMLDGQVAIPAGPLDAGATDTVIDADPGAMLSFVDDQGRNAMITVGSVTADGMQLPKDLKGELTVRALADGRVLILGGPGVRPLSFSVDWPIVRTDPDAEITVTAVGRRPLVLVRPTTGRSHRTTAA